MTHQNGSTCGCDDFRVSRRRFLKGSLGAAGSVAATALIGDVFTQVAYGAEPGSNVLVVLSLRGGADGLSLVVPHGDPAYTVARPRIGVPASALLARDAMFGLHPALSPLLPMWQSGRMAAVHAVGMAQPNRSHFAAMEAIEDADPTSMQRRGWINRMVGLLGTSDPTEAIQLGSPMSPTSMYGSTPTLAAAKLGHLKLPGSADLVWYDRQEQSLSGLWSKVRGPLGRGARSALSTAKTLAPLANASVRPQNGARYPAGDLGSTLAETASLIRADVGARVVTVDYGGWDMHTGMGTASSGQMRGHVAELAGALAAFFSDLGTAADRVTLVTLSEFGRRVEENGAYGLDHGHGNCVLVLGAGVKGGRYYGRWPGLGAGKLVNGDLAVTTDYRSVLADIARSRFPEANLSKVFPSFQREHVGVMA